MASSVTTAEANSILDTSLSGRYVALFTADPTDTGSVANEVSGGSYARQSVTFGSASNRSASNSSAVTFPVATTSWGAITHMGLAASDTAGTDDLKWHGSLTTSKTIDTDDQIKFNIGGITVSIAAAA